MNIATTCIHVPSLLVMTTYICSKPVQPVFKWEYHLHIGLLCRVQVCVNRKGAFILEISNAVTNASIIYAL